MIGFVLFLSVFAAMGLAWFALTLGYVLHMGGFERLMSLPLSEFVFISAGLFCPVVVLALGVAFVYLALEMRKTQLLLDIYVHKVSGGAKKAAEPEEITLPLPDETPLKDAVDAAIQDRPILNISTQENIEKYKDISLPDNLDLHFVDKT